MPNAIIRPPYVTAKMAATDMYSYTVIEKRPDSPFNFLGAIMQNLGATPFCKISWCWGKLNNYKDWHCESNTGVVRNMHFSSNLDGFRQVTAEIN